MYGAVGLNSRNFVSSKCVRNFGAAGLSPISFGNFVGWDFESAKQHLSILVHFSSIGCRESSLPTSWGSYKKFPPPDG